MEQIRSMGQGRDGMLGHSWGASHPLTNKRLDKQGGEWLTWGRPVWKGWVAESEVKVRSPVPWPLLPAGTTLPVRCCPWLQPESPYPGWSKSLIPSSLARSGRPPPGRFCDAAQNGRLRQLGLLAWSVNSCWIIKHFLGLVDDSSILLEGRLPGSVMIRKLTKTKPYQMSPWGVWYKAPGIHSSMCGPGGLSVHFFSLWTFYTPLYLCKELSLDWTSDKLVHPYSRIVLSNKKESTINTQWLEWTSRALFWVL